MADTAVRRSNLTQTSKYPFDERSAIRSDVAKPTGVWLVLANSRVDDRRIDLGQRQAPDDGSQSGHLRSGSAAVEDRAIASNSTCR